MPNVKIGVGLGTPDAASAQMETGQAWSFRTGGGGGVLYSGSGAPSLSVGGIGDFYVDETDFPTSIDLYGPKVEGDWGSPITLGAGGVGATAFTDLTDVPASYAGAAGKLTSVNASENALEFTDPPPPSGQSRLISGGAVIWQHTDFMFTVTAATYLINGVQYSSPETDIELSDANPDFDRIDVIAVDDSGAVVIIEGDPGGPPAEPQIDPATQLKLTFILVPAGSTEPVITDENLYLENTEWTSSTNSAGTINLASTINARTGTKDIEASTAISGNYIQLVKPTGTLTLSDFSLLIFYVRSKGAWGTKKGLSIFWQNSGTNVGSAVALKQGTFNFDSSNTTDYQLIAIPISLFAVPDGAAINTLRLTVSGAGGGSIGFYMDDMIAQAGVVNGTGITKFIDLTDTPSTYTGAGNKIVSVKASEDGLEFTDAPGGSFTPGDLTDAGTDGIVITGGTGAVNGTGTSIAQDKADATHNGYLDKDDWSAFNAKSEVATFLDLTDTPGLYDGSSDKFVHVKIDESGLEFSDVPTGAPLAAHYVTTQDESGLSNEFNLGGLSDGILKQTVATGVATPAIATEGSDYLGSARIDDTAYDASSWDGDTDHAPSKNAVRDKIESLSALNKSIVGATWYNAGDPVDAGKAAGFIAFPVAGTITAWAISVDTGTATIKVWKVATGTAVPDSSNSINTSGVSISSGTHVRSTTLTDFGANTGVAANDIFAFNLESVTGSPTEVSFQLEIQK